jgi:hypothetical protein
LPNEKKKFISSTVWGQYGDRREGLGVNFGTDLLINKDAKILTDPDPQHMGKACF